MNIMYRTPTESQIIPLSDIEMLGLRGCCVFKNIHDITYKCRSTSKLGIEGTEIFEGSVIQDPGGNIGVAYWNNSEAQFIIDFLGEACTIDDESHSWAKVLGHIGDFDTKPPFTKKQFRYATAGMLFYKAN